MPSVSEGVVARSELAGDLAAGVEAISSNQTIRFTKYVRLILPLDGYVFWVKADLVSPSAIPNAAVPNDAAPDEAPGLSGKAATMDVPGSLHYATDNRQQADSSYAVNRVVFTSLERVNAFNDVGPDVMYIAEFEGLKFAFSSRKSFYRQSGLHHYVGDAVYPIMESQLVDKLDGFRTRLIVSNSLPVWLSMNGYVPEVYEAFGNDVRLYPAFLVNGNAEPPFAAVDVTSSAPIAASPRLGRTLSHDQQVRDRVRVTLWGLDNDAAMDFVDFVEQFSLNTEAIGLANAPVVREERVTQPELGVIAQKKIVEYEVNYHQRSARDVARQLILRAVPSFIFN